MQTINLDRLFQQMRYPWKHPHYLLRRRSWTTEYWKIYKYTKYFELKVRHFFLHKISSHKFFLYITRLIIACLQHQVTKNTTKWIREKWKNNLYALIHRLPKGILLRYKIQGDYRGSFYLRGVFRIAILRSSAGGKKRAEQFVTRCWWRCKLDMYMYAVILHGRIYLYTCT